MQSTTTNSCSLKTCTKPLEVSSSDFFLHQFNTACLSEFAYYIESNGEVAIIDPLRETKPYLELAESRNAKIKYVIETHFHADFVSGHVELASKTGAKIIYGPNAVADFEMYSAKDEEELPLGNVTFKVLHTPGHTMESTCYLLLDSKKEAKCVFTGDTLFLGAVGRPDLAVKSAELTKEDLAGFLYDSLQKKIMPLDDNVIVYPAHGAGSACGKGISGGTSSTMAEQKKTNYALQPMTREEFVTIISSNLPTPPQYFFHDVALNKSNSEGLDSILKRSFKPLSVQQTEELTSQGAIIVDCRDTKDFFETGVIPGSMTISLALPFAVWVGTILKPADKLIVLTPPGKEEEAIIRLARVGYENCQGYLEGGVEQYVKEGKKLEKIEVLEAEEQQEEASKKNPVVLDVRNPPEWESGVYKGSVRIPLAQLENRIGELEKNAEHHILCKSGMRATIAYTLLRRFGFENVTLVKGGVDKLVSNGGLQLEEFKSQ